MLNEYISQTQLFLGVDSASTVYPVANLTTFVNMARQQVAAEGQCVRILLPAYASIGQLVLNSSDNYASPPLVRISAPDQVTSVPGIQATATAILSGTLITSLSITNAGRGYFQPSVTFSSGRSSAYATTTAVCATSAGQQIYTYSQFSGLVRANAGVSSILAVQGISFLWGTTRFSRAAVSFSKFQALINNYNAVQDIPYVVANYGQGVSGSFYVYPTPDQPYGMEIDCLCLPQQLTNDSDPESIPAPWTSVVKYYATHYALLGAQRFDDADKWKERAERKMKETRAYAQPGQVANWYGRRY